MHRTSLALAALLLTPVATHADCQSGIAAAMRRANALPSSFGRAALLEQIQRAIVARHEGDEADCADQLEHATSVLDEIDAAKKREASGHDATPDDATPHDTTPHDTTPHDATPHDEHATDAPKP